MCAFPFFLCFPIKIQIFPLSLQKRNSQACNSIFSLLFSSFLPTPHSQPFSNADGKCYQLRERNRDDREQVLGIKHTQPFPNIIYRRPRSGPSMLFGAKGIARNVSVMLPALQEPHTYSVEIQGSNTESNWSIC